MNPPKRRVIIPIIASLSLPTQGEKLKQNVTRFRRTHPFNGLNIARQGLETVRLPTFWVQHSKSDLPPFSGVNLGLKPLALAGSGEAVLWLYSL
jgi:hypothetical protein